MTAREQAEQLRQQAIQTLLEEKESIDKMLKTLGCGECPTGKRRGRRPKQAEDQEISESALGQDGPSPSQNEA